jgi:hypothetical protein
MSHTADDQEVVLGRLLMDIVHGDLTNETIELVDQLDLEDLALPMHHLVAFVQGMNMSPQMRSQINSMLLTELKGITIEQQEDLFPSREQEPPPWRPDAPIPGRALPIIKDLLLEILQGKIRYKTLTAIDDLGELENVPEPFREILSLVQGSREDGEELAGFLIYNLSGMIEELKKLRR